MAANDNDFSTPSSTTGIQTGGGYGQANAGIGEFIGGKFTYVKMTISADISAKTGHGESQQKLAQYMSQFGTIVVMAVKANGLLVSFVIEGATQLGESGFEAGDLNTGGTAAIDETVSNAAITDLLELA